ncbi:MAG TPA: hypothetical protein VN260_05685 [Dissulfurispiraceae bacterium]|nr:hypothetical protein [Dissulfurispiraceae bacterium]
MGKNGVIRLLFGVSRKEIGRYWKPVVIELRRKGTNRMVQFIAENSSLLKERDGLCYIEFDQMPRGVYALTVRDAHSGEVIVKEPRIELREDVLEYEFLRRKATKQPNTSAMDLVVDAPYRLEKNAEYLPVIVYLKDIEAESVRFASVSLHAYGADPDIMPEPIPAGGIIRVYDGDGRDVEENGRPCVLRFDDGERYETVRTDPWYRVILIDRTKLEVIEGQYPGYGKTRYIKYAVIVDFMMGILGFGGRRHFVLHTLVPDSNLPVVEEWYYGDTHYHSDFTDNPYEYGGPLSMTAEVARATGLSWVTVTDHSYCLSHPKTPEEEDVGNRWFSYQKAVSGTNDGYPDVLLVAAEEVTVRQHLLGLHLLSFNNPFIEDTHPAGFGTFPLEEVLEHLLEGCHERGGFVYAAHPSSEGYVWKDEDYAVASKPRYKEVFRGLQLFNEKVLFGCRTESSIDREYLDPFDMMKKCKRRSPWAGELEEGVLNHWVERLLLPPLRDYERTRELTKYFILAGSDAHMDFNCSFRPHPAFLIHYLYDNAFGKVRTLAHLPGKNREGLKEPMLLDALKTGRTLLTDGPVVLFSIRKKGQDGVCRFGDTLSLKAGERLELLIEWCSTAEFGRIGEMRLFRGTAEGEEDLSGVVGLPVLCRQAGAFNGSTTFEFTKWPSGPSYLRMEGSSRIDPKTGEALFRCMTNPIWILAE